MLSDPTTIFFSTELQVPPVEVLKFSKAQIRGLYNKLSEPGGYAYENLDLQDDIPTLSTRRPDGESLCRIGDYKIVIEEENPEVTADGFIEIVQTVLAALGGEFPPVVVHRVKIECLSRPTNSDGSIELLAGKLSDVLGAERPFGRYPSFFGVRFRFSPRNPIGPDNQTDDDSDDDSPKALPPAEGDRIDQEAAAASEPGEGASVCDDAFVTLRYETYSKDTKQVWMEVSAEYVHPLRNTDSIESVAANIRDTYKFLTERAKSFLEQFDVPDESDEEEDES